MEQPEVTPIARYDLDKIVAAIAVLFADVQFGAGECIEVRIPDKRKHLTAAGWFDDVKELAKVVARAAHSGFGERYRHIHENIYWTANPVNDALLSRQPKNKLEIAAETTSDNNITRRLWLPIDIDPLRPAGVSATSAEKKLALEVTRKLLEHLQELGFPSNCFVGGTSGNGYHILVRIDLPNNVESRDLLKKCLAAMQEMVGTGKVEVDPKVFNAARIIKSYGTRACKGANTEDRPWRWSKLTLIPETIEVAGRELLEKLAALAPEKNPKRDLGSKRQGPWTVENTQSYIDWTSWDGVQKGGGGPGETAKWIGTCLVDGNHKDAALILHDDGWWSYSCFHASCADFRHKAFTAYWEAELGKQYQYPGKRTSFKDISADWDIADVEGEEPSIAPAVEGKRAEPQKFHLTDAGNGERLTYRWGNVFRYCTQRGWFYWTGKRWMLDEVEKVSKAALETVRRIPDELPLHLEGVEGEEAQGKVTNDVLAWAKASEGKGHLNAAVELCHSIGKGINVVIGIFDRELWYFNCDNGTLDLRNGAFHEHRQEDLITNISPVSYDPKVECPLWLEFLDTVMAGDQEMIAFLKRAAGYSLTGSTAAHCLFMLYGSGRNGKTTFLEVLQHLMGTYGTTTSMEIFLAKAQEGIPNDLAALCHARFVTGMETEDGRRLAEAKVKQITGGDTISARFLHKEFFKFLPQFKVWIGTNHKPIIRGTDEGIWRRIRLIPFTVYIQDGRVDETLKGKLLSEASGILNWALAGLDEYRLGGLMEPAAVLAATEDYRKQEDWLQRFLDSETIQAVRPEQRTQARDVYNRYKTWAEDSKEYVQPERKFNESMDSHGVEFDKKGNKKLYHLTLRDHLANFSQRERIPEPEEVL